MWLVRLMFAPSAIVNIVFRHGESSIGAVTDAKQRPGFPADPPAKLSRTSVRGEMERVVLNALACGLSA